MADEASAELSYREESVDSAIDNHEKRISRLEKAFLIGVGYVLADQDMLFEALLGLVL